MLSIRNWLRVPLSQHYCNFISYFTEEKGALRPMYFVELISIKMGLRINRTCQADVDLIHVTQGKIVWRADE